MLMYNLDIHFQYSIIFLFDIVFHFITLSIKSYFFILYIRHLKLNLGKIRILLNFIIYPVSY